MPDSYDALYDRLERVRQDYMKLDAKHQQLRAVHRDALDQIHQLELSMGDPDADPSTWRARLAHLRAHLDGPRVED